MARVCVVVGVSRGWKKYCQKGQMVRFGSIHHLGIGWLSGTSVEISEVVTRLCKNRYFRASESPVSLHFQTFEDFQHCHHKVIAGNVQFIFPQLDMEVLTQMFNKRFRVEGVMKMPWPAVAKSIQFLYPAESRGQTVRYEVWAPCCHGVRIFRTLRDNSATEDNYRMGISGCFPSNVVG